MLFSVFRILLSILILLNSNLAHSSIDNRLQSSCLQIIDKDYLTVNWRDWKPYQSFFSFTIDKKLKGMDIEILQNIAESTSIELKFFLNSWEQTQKSLEKGEIDVAMAVTHSQERSKYMHFSKAYRYEENAIFVRNDNKKYLPTKKIEKILSSIRLQDFRLGIIKAFVYASPLVNYFINQEDNQDIIYTYDSEAEAMNDLLKGKIDGFLSDRLAAIYEISNRNLEGKIKEINLKLKTELHFAFSKKTISSDFVEKFNLIIEKAKNEANYRKILEKYFSKILILKIANMQSIHYFIILGVVGYSIAAVFIAVREKVNLLAILLLAVLPSTPIGIARDFLIGRGLLSDLFPDSYLYYMLISVIFVMIFIRILVFVNIKIIDSFDFSLFSERIIRISEFIARSCFIASAPLIAASLKFMSIAFFGSVFAFVFAKSGEIMRNLLLSAHSRLKNNILNESLNGEIALIFGAIFGFWLDKAVISPENMEQITLVTIVIFILSFTCFLLTYHFNITNITIIPECKFKDN